MSKFLDCAKCAFFWFNCTHSFWSYLCFCSYWIWHCGCSVIVDTKAFLLGMEVRDKNLKILANLLTLKPSLTTKIVRFVSSRSARMNLYWACRVMSDTTFTSTASKSGADKTTLVPYAWKGLLRKRSNNSTKPKSKEMDKLRLKKKRKTMIVYCYDPSLI